MNKWFVIRADANNNIGLGHLMRCLALAEWAKLDDIHAVLLSIDIPLTIYQKLSELGITVIQLTNNGSGLSDCSYPHSHWLPVTELEDANSAVIEIQQQVQIRGSLPIFIMVDHYALGAPWEKELSDIAPILGVDDLSDRPHCCSWLIDQTYGKTTLDYVKIVNTNCEIKVGSAFALIRPEFKNVSDSFERKAPLTEKPLRILITLGGADTNNVTTQVLKMLDKTKIIDHIFITVVAGAVNPHLAELKQYCSLMKCETNFVVNSKEMANLMLTHDICIGAAGSTSWERCTLGLPTLNIVLAANQRLIAIKLDEIGAAVNLGTIEQITAKLLEKHLNHFYHSQDSYLHMVSICRNICDGMGCQRILNTILGVYGDKNISCLQ